MSINNIFFHVNITEMQTITQKTRHTKLDENCAKRHGK